MITLHFELILSGKSIDDRLHAEKIDRICAILLNRYPVLVTRKSLLYQHDNDPAHRSHIVKQKLRELREI